MIRQFTEADPANTKLSIDRPRPTADLATTLCGSTATRGGGLYGSGCEITLTQCVFFSNESHYSIPTVGDGDNGTGGGVFLDDGRYTLIDCELRQNDAGGGGGIATDNADLDLLGCTLVSNSALFGGGTFVLSTRVRVVNTVFHGNFAAFGSACLPTFTRKR